MGACHSSAAASSARPAQSPRSRRFLYLHEGFSESDCEQVFRSFDPHNTGLVRPTDVRACLCKMAQLSMPSTRSERLNAFVEDFRAQLQLDEDGCLAWAQLRMWVMASKHDLLESPAPAEEAKAGDSRELEKLRAMVAQCQRHNEELRAQLQRGGQLPPDPRLGFQPGGTAGGPQIGPQDGRLAPNRPLEEKQREGEAIPWDTDQKEGHMEGGKEEPREAEGPRAKEIKGKPERERREGERDEPGADNAEASETNLLLKQMVELEALQSQRRAQQIATLTAELEALKRAVNA